MRNGSEGRGATVPIDIQRDEVRRLVAAGAQLVDVLPRAEYDAEHIAGAISIPLKELDAQSTAILDRDRPVIVYCWDIL
jgi:rhodanese-related sulfurtransferase